MKTINDFRYNQRVTMIDPDDGKIVTGTVVNISYTDNEVTINWDDLSYDCEHDETEFQKIKEIK
jgi:hypothetical protein